MSLYNLFYDLKTFLYDFYITFYMTIFWGKKPIQVYWENCGQPNMYKKLSSGRFFCACSLKLFLKDS